MRILVAFILFSFCIHTHAQVTDVSEHPSIIMASDQPASQIDPLAPTELIIEIDHTQFIDDVGGQLRADASEAERKSFLIRTLINAKEKLPPKMDRLFDQLGLPDDLKKFLINDYLLPKLENAPAALESAKAKGGVARIYGVVGLGFSDYILKHLKTKKWGHWLPSRASFGLALGLGSSVLFFEHEGKRKVMIRLFSLTEKSDKIINWMSEIMGIVSIGKVSDQLVNYFENPRMFGTENKDYHRSILSVAGSMIAEKNHFEYTFDLAMGILFPGGFYDLKGKYRSIYIVVNRDFIKDLKTQTQKRCLRFFK